MLAAAFSISSASNKRSSDGGISTSIASTGASSVISSIFTMVQFVIVVVLMRVECRQWLMLREKMEILRNHESVFLS
jgi:hypothetical protein